MALEKPRPPHRDSTGFRIRYQGTATQASTATLDESAVQYFCITLKSETNTRHVSWICERSVMMGGSGFEFRVLSDVPLPIWRRLLAIRMFR